MSVFEKVTEERKKEAKKLICSFIDSMTENDRLSFGGDIKTDYMGLNGVKTMWLNGEMKLGAENEKDD
jgi:hypothetical protein